MASELIRAFLALPLAPSFESDVRPLLEKLGRDYPATRWVEASQIHATLHFFGSIPSEEVEKISGFIRPIASRSKPLQIVLKGFGAFPSPSRPRVIWVGMEGDTEGLKNLHRFVEKELEKNGFPIESRGFKPHLALGRIREGKKFSDFPEIQFGPTGSKSINVMVLFQSPLTPQGARYEAIETYPFSPP